jgi:molecular chaperone HtpG
MSLIINAVYTNKEVFIRELISNASDALDKIRYQSLTDKDVLGDQQELKIEIVPDVSNNTLTIRDTGIGMTKEDLIENLGTIARSGTKQFMEAIQAGADISMIGQFGVGFYSAFLVADKITVITKHNDESHYLWESSADGSFRIGEVEHSDIIRGTSIVLHLKDDALEFLEENKLKELVKTHSQYISFPIELYVEKEVEEKEDVDDKEESLDEKDEDLNEKGEEDVEEDDVKVEELKNKVVKEFERLNDQKPIWVRKSEDVTDEEYQAFYKNVSGDHGEYSRVKHFSVEGNLVFSSLLFLPKNKPFDMFGGGEEKLLNKIKLYVRRVFILDNCKDLLPEYLNFVVGVVDSNDLPLNVSREMVQENAILRVIKKQLVKKTIEMMSELSDNKEDYQAFYDSFSKNIKLGTYEDSANRDKLVKLLRFSTT